MLGRYGFSEDLGIIQEQEHYDIRLQGRLDIAGDQTFNETEH